MSRLFVVRHGQASFLEPDYDKLSRLGEKQSQLLGEHWAALGVSFSHIYSGPRVRQKETARIAREAANGSASLLPEAELLPQFDEFQGEAVMDRCLPGLLERDAELRRIHEVFLAAPKGPEQHRSFQRVFEQVIRRWIRGEVEAEGIESWQAFRERVRSGYERIAQRHKGDQSVAVFTSGGPIGIAMQKALQLTDEKALESGMMMRNAGCCEFLFSGDRFTLSSYNSLPHLTDPALLTYR